MHGSGIECICEMHIVDKPPRTSPMGMKLRGMQLLGKGIKLAWHPNIPFEIHGVCTVKQGKADWAIQNIKVSTNEEVGSWNNSTNTVYV